MINDNNSFEHFVYFTYKLEWEISKEFEPEGYLSVFLPKSFPLNSQIFRVPIDQRNGFFEKTIDACVDDFFIDSAIRKSFLHIARYSKKNLNKVLEKIKNKSSAKNNKNNIKTQKSKTDKKEYTERFTCESIFLDAGVLFIPDRKEASITVNMEIFDYLTFSIQIDEELLTIPHIKKFAPAILHINKIDNFFNSQNQLNNNNELYSNPIYFECQVGSNSYFLVPRYDKTQNTISIDAVILIAPRKDESIVFRILDKIEEIPSSTFIGSGLYTPFNIGTDEEEENYEEEEDKKDKQILVKSISEENLIEKSNKKNDKKSKHHHQHHSKKKSHLKDDSFIQTMKKVEEMANHRPFIQFISPLKSSLCEPEKQFQITPIHTPISRKSPRDKEINSGRRSRIMNDDQMYNMYTPIAKTPQKINSSTKMNISTEVLPKKQINFDEQSEFGYCQFYLFPERHSHMKMVSSTNSDNYKNVTISFDIYDPASRFPEPAAIQEIKRPLTLHKRPPITNRKEVLLDNYKHAPKSNMNNNNNQTKINMTERTQIRNSINIFVTSNKELFTEDNNLSKIFPEDPKILSIEKPTIKLLRWILSCQRFSPVSLKLSNFIHNFHKTTIHGFSHILNPCFKNCVRKSPDLITGFHFVSPKEEVFVLETRAYRPNKASLSLELFLRNEMPPETHIICNSSIVFPAPRLYCCTDDLIKRVEIPISLDELLQINGLYFHKNENHKLFPIAQKLTNILQSRTAKEISDSFPNYSEIKLLEKRASGLYAAPLQKSLSITPIVHAKGADFGDSNSDHDHNYNLIINNNNSNNLNIINNYYVSINDKHQASGPKQFQEKEKIVENKERLTTFYLAKPGCGKKQRNESVSMKSKKMVNDEAEENLMNPIYIKPPDSNKISSQKAPRNISSTKQPS